uniref:beta strand repeat-containing protein n=1 Tax=Paraburkholderia caffeinilytica TaxID=1761016 RepID=UPI0038B84BE6
MGSLSRASGDAGTALGVNATASGDRSVAIGASSTGTGSYSTAVGTLAIASGSNSAAFGTQSSASAANSVALGAKSTTTANLSAAGYNPGTAALSGTASTANGEVSVGSTGKERRVTNVAAGSAATDAVNVSQLQSEDAKVNTINNNVNNLSNNVSNIAGNVTNISNTVNNITNGGGIKYFHANSTLADSSASGVDSVAIGGAATASAANSIALGSSTKTAMANDIAIGNGATTTAGATNTDNLGAIAMGGNAKAYGAGTVAGGANIAIGKNAVAGKSDASVSQALALGTNTQATNWNTTALGTLATASGSGSTAVGNQSTAAGDQATALGLYSSASGNSSTALGQAAKATALNSVALGANSTTTANLSAAGYNPGTAALSGTASTANGEVSVGSTGKERRVTNVAAGSAATDAVNVSQLQSEDAKVNTINNNVNNLSNNVSNIAGNVTNISNTVNNITNGGGIKYFHANSTLADSSASGVDAVAIGGAATASAKNSVALGSGSTTTANLSAAGYNPGTAALSGTASVANGEVSVGATGKERRVTNVAAGSAATDAVNVSQLMSEDAKVKQNTSDITNLNTQITNINGQMADAVVYDSSAHDLVTLGGEKGTKITNLTAGDVSATSTDAVNGSQLYATNQNMSNIAGDVTNISNTVNNITNGGTGIKYFHANSTLADSSASGVDAVAIGGAATASAKNSVALGSGSTTTANLSAAGYNPGTAALSGTASTANGEVSMGASGKERRVTNVAAGSAATDAVNVSQLQSEDAKVNTINNNVNNLSNNVSNIAGNVTNISNTVNNITNGGGIKYFHANSTLADSSASGVDSVAIGGAALASAKNSVALGSGSTTTANLSAAGYNPGTAALSGTASAANGEVSVGASGKERRVTNVAAGSAATDAVNVSQLMSEDAKVNAAGADTAAALGGGSSYDSTTGVITNPTYVVDGGKTFSNVGDVITNIDGRTTQNTTDISTLNSQITNINGQMADAVMYDSSAHDVVTLGGKSGTKITNLTAADLSASSTDAVNGSQLYETNQNVTNVAGNVSNISNTVNNITNGGTGIKYFHANSTLADSSATGVDSLAAGPAAVASATNAVALGNGAKAANAGAVALGAGSTTTTAVATTGTTIGGITYKFAGAAPLSTVSVGAAGSERTITNVAAGRLSATSTDAVNGSELYATNQQVTQNSTDITNLTNNINNGSVGLVQQDATSRNITVAKDTDGTVVDFTGTAGARKLTGVSAGDVNATSLDAVNGSQLYAMASSTADALGGGSTVNNDGTITKPTYVVDGTTVNNVGDAITNIDGRVTENTTDITNINNTLNNISNGGMGVKYFHANSMLADSQATGAESVAIGGNAQSLAANSVALGSNSVADRANTVSVGAAGAERQITNVAAGTADTDAVNVAQLKASGIINPNGTTNAAVTYDHNADGSTNYSSVTMGDGVAGGTTIHNVAAGTAGDDAVNVNQMNAAISTVTNIAKSGGNPMFAADGSRDTEGAVASGTHSTAMGANASASAANSVALGANSVADRANTVSVGSAGNERQVTNVAAGTATTDAVNVGQLNDSIGAAVGNLPAGMTAKNYTDQQINSVQNSVNAVAKNAYSGIAAATALTMIPDVDQGKTIAVGIGGGSYKGSQAVALGVSARITENLKMKAGAGTSQGGTTVGVGASYQW